MTRTRIVVAVIAVGGALAWVAGQGLTTNLVYYQTPTELLGGGADAVGERVRLGGLVAEGSVERSGERVRFILTDGSTRITVVDEAGVPALFRDGRGVVVEGVYGADGTFRADTILVRHGDSYAPPGPGETPAYDPPDGG